MGLRSKSAKRKRKNDDEKPTVKKFGRFTADGVCLKEVAINNRVLRIPLSRAGQSTKPRSRHNSNRPQAFKANGLGKSTLSNRPAATNKKLRKRKPKYTLSLRKSNLSNRPAATGKELSKRKPKHTLRYLEALQQALDQKKKAARPPLPIEMAFVKAPDVTLKENKKSYCLQLMKTVPFYQCTLSIDFNKLSEGLRRMKLPTPSWKIKMWVRNEQTTTVSITNNQELERSVTFKAKSKFFTIRVDNVPVILLGCPKTVSTIKDVEVLVNIVSTIPLTDVMVLKI